MSLFKPVSFAHRADLLGATSLRTPRFFLPASAHGGQPYQTQGAMTCVVIERREIREVYAKSANGDWIAQTVIRCLDGWMAEAFKQAPPQCAFCDHTFEHAMQPEAFIVGVPMRGDGGHVVTAICKKCVKSIGSESLPARAIEHYKKLWPKAQVTKLVKRY